MNRYYEKNYVVFLDENGDVYESVDFPTYKDAETYCMERDWTEIREGGLILYLDIRRRYEKVVEE